MKVRPKLSRQRRAIPYIYMLLAAAGIILHLDAALIFGALIIGRIEAMENSSIEARMAFAEAIDSAIRKRWERP